jgi:hypothetical protein
VVTERISTAFLSHASEALAKALSGNEIVRITSAHAVDHAVDIPHASYPFQAPNKRTALFENLQRFSPQQQYEILRELTDKVAYWGSAQEIDRKAATDLKHKLHMQYGHLSTSLDEGVNESVVTRARHLLDDYPEAKKLFDGALSKYRAHSYTRNALDDMRLALETLLKGLLANERSLENQVASVGQFVSEHGGSPQLANMFQKLIDYYTKYQNTYVKHNDAVPLAEVEFVVDITASFMKHLVQIKGGK